MSPEKEMTGCSRAGPQHCIRSKSAQGPGGGAVGTEACRRVREFRDGLTTAFRFQVGAGRMMGREKLA